jgi:hypothetical protein
MDRVSVDWPVSTDTQGGTPVIAAVAVEELTNPF